MKTIDLKPDQVGCLCLLCDCYGVIKVAEFDDREVGPVCSECFGECLRVNRQLSWSCISTNPSTL